MKRTLKICLVVLTILTAAFIGAVAYATTNSSYYGSLRYVSYAAYEFKSDMLPAEWYIPEQLGIYEVYEYQGGAWLHIAVDRESEPFPLQEKQPIFMYKDKFYQVSADWATPAVGDVPKIVRLLPDQYKQQQWQFPLGTALAVGWIFTGALFLKRRKNN